MHWMRYVRLALFVSALPLAAQLQPGAATIEGRVLNSASSAPIARVTVTLYTPGPGLVAETDGQGRYRFTGLPPGRYRVSAHRTGFIDRSFGDRQPILLDRDQNLTVDDLRLPPQGVITGRVFQEDGDPVAGAQVALLKQVWRDGKKRWLPASMTVSNDAGEYRIANLSPGRYLIQVVSRWLIPNTRFGGALDTSDKPEMTYAPVYYPNAPSEQAASPVEVSVGADLRGIDIHLFKSPSYRVRVAVAGNVAASIRLLPISGDSAYSASTATAPADFHFELRGILPGAYTLIARPLHGIDGFGSQTVNVAGDVNGIVITIAPPVDLTGQITVAENGGDIKLQNINVLLQPDDIVSGHQYNAHTDAAGKLRFNTPVTPGHFKLVVTALPETCFVQSVKFGGQAMTLEDVSISAPAPLDIVLSNTAGKVTGTAIDKDGKPFARAIVTLFSDVPGERPFSRDSNTSGSFTFSGVPPGSYKLYAWDGVESGEWEDPDFRKPFDDRAVDVKLGSSDTQTVQAHVIVIEAGK